MKTSFERVEQLLLARRVIDCMILNEHRGDDALALHALEAIKYLSLALYPFPPDSDITQARAAALGVLRGETMRAIDGKWPSVFSSGDSNAH